MENKFNFGLLDMYQITEQNQYLRCASGEIRVAEELKKALESIRNSTLNEAEDDAFYKYLISIAPDEEAKEFINKIKEDEEKHEILLREVYYDLTGLQIPKNSMVSQTQFNISFLEGLKNAFKGEISAMERYRTILKAMDKRQNYDKIFEIMTDEMKHATKYNYLINKYNK